MRRDNSRQIRLMDGGDSFEEKRMKEGQDEWGMGEEERAVGLVKKTVEILRRKRGEMRK